MNTAAIAQHLNIAESAIIKTEEWASVLFVVCRRLGARFVNKKVLEIPMNNYDRLIARFTEAGNPPEVAKKATSMIFSLIWDCRDFSEISHKFNAVHHDFIKEIIKDERAKNEAQEKAADAVADAYQEKFNDNWEALDSYTDSPVSGSPKQQSWAKSIRGFAVENWLAPAVAAGKMEYQKAVEILKNPDCKYWIDNRKDWGCR